MEFSIKALSPEAAKAGCVVVGVHSGKELTPAARRLDQAARGALRKPLGDLSGKTGTTLLLRDAVSEAAATADGTTRALALGNLSSNTCTPSYLAAEAQKIARHLKLGVEVLERKDMEKLGMGALLSVARASHRAAKLTVPR